MPSMPYKLLVRNGHGVVFCDARNMNELPEAIGDGEVLQVFCPPDEHRIDAQFCNEMMRNRAKWRATYRAAGQVYPEDRP